MKQIDPALFSRNLPRYLTEIHSGSRMIYFISLLLILALLISLPLIRIQVSVMGQGIIRPEWEKAEIVAPIGGIVEEVYVSEGDELQKSAPILRIRSQELIIQLQMCRDELNETSRYLADLGKLLDLPVQVPEGPRFRNAFESYQNRLAYLEALLGKAGKECERNEGLYRMDLISEKEYDDLCFARDKASKEILHFSSEVRSRWQTLYNQYLLREKELKSQAGQWEERIRQNHILTPVTGSLEEFDGIFPGTSVQAGSVIGVMSPQSKLIGEVYIKPKDIAFIHMGQSVQFRMESFPPREWGTASGEIYDISDDFLLMGNLPVYRVKSTIRDTCLNLRNGYVGHLKKGMTFQARCLIIPRSLFQLLLDKSVNWLQP